MQSDESSEIFEEQEGQDEEATDQVSAAPVEATVSKTSKDNSKAANDPQPAVDKIKARGINSADDAISAAAEIALKLPAHAGKSAKQHAADIAGAIRDLKK